jgi:ubiquinone/menaquinone biosynthesis C-methylase UbiE
MTAKPPKYRGRSVREDWDGSAREYAAFASQKGLYRQTAGAMVECARIEPGMVIIDLACGSGVVTRAILDYGPPDIRIISVDFSSEMLACARSHISSPAVTFVQGRAEELSRIVTTRVDRVLCNAAFWHFDRVAVSAEISRVLKPSGKCLVGMPTQDFKVIDMNRNRQDNKAIWMIMEEKSLRGYISTGPRSQRELRRLNAVAQDKNEVFEYLANGNLQLERIETVSADLAAKDFVEFLRIPVMAKNSFLFSGISFEESQQILDVVTNQLEWVDASMPSNTWQIFVLSRNPDQPLR